MQVSHSVTASTSSHHIEGGVTGLPVLQRSSIISFVLLSEMDELTPVHKAVNHSLVLCDVSILNASHNCREPLKAATLWVVWRVQGEKELRHLTQLRQVTEDFGPIESRWNCKEHCHCKLGSCGIDDTVKYRDISDDAEIWIIFHSNTVSVIVTCYFLSLSVFRKFSLSVDAGHKSVAHCWIIEEHPKKQEFGACLTHEQRAAYLSLCSDDALAKLCLTWFVIFGPPIGLYCTATKTFLLAFESFFCLYLCLFLNCWSQLEASEVGLGQ